MVDSLGLAASSWGLRMPRYPKPETLFLLHTMFVFLINLFALNVAQIGGEFRIPNSRLDIALAKIRATDFHIRSTIVRVTGNELIPVLNYLVPVLFSREDPIK